LERNSKGQFIKGVRKNESWYEAMAKRTGSNHSNYKPLLHKVEMIECECGCGEFFNKYDSRGRERRYMTGHFNKILGTVGCRNHIHLAIEAIRGKKRKKEGEYITPGSKRERGRFRREMQRKVFERDDYTCCVCGQEGGELQVDHIQSWADYPELRFEMDNCRTVCMSCHYYVTFKRKLPKGVKWGHNFSKAQKQSI
jgi:5-methylcytosine-specific restriction endonuclease McrA